MDESAGKLILVPTPLGNLGDITLRSIQVLEEAQVIAAEDTRRTRSLLTHLKIKKPVVSCFRHNETQRESWLLAELAAGHLVALVSDAGMPGLCDPGLALAKIAREAGFEVDVLPGPSAVLLALVQAGFPCDSFTFGGYLPRHRKGRTACYEALRQEERTAVFFEAPHRLAASLADCAAVLPGREIAVARELTKLHQEVFRGSVEAAVGHFAEGAKGEIVLVLAGAAKSPPPAPRDYSPEAVREIYQQQLAQGIHPKQALKEVMAQTALSRQEAYGICRKAETNEKGEN